MFRGIALFALFAMTISAIPTGGDNGNDLKDAGLHDNGKHNGQKDRSGDASTAPFDGSPTIPSDFSSSAPTDSTSSHLCLLTPTRRILPMTFPARSPASIRRFPKLFPMLLPFLLKLALLLRELSPKFLLQEANRRQIFQLDRWLSG
ncbi:hypothetical protein L596_013386 [Steinernema carpocapsae]|uniref:Uncharacterized protein n=1 Tax=Steinernema carpocapsae TaxID=34508 RepID=A0A4U5P0M7_STECR|nr:hypothetical protein L596_013386 [Steinernema carpocapsae]